MDCKGYLERAFDDHIGVMKIMKMADTRKIESVAEVLYKAIARGSKLMVFGNGGSAADAQHFAAELVGWYLDKQREGYPALCLSNNSSTITAIANDSGYDQVFARQVQAYGQYGDVVVGITTSGNSPNVVEGLKAAKDLDLETIALTGGKEGAVAPYADYMIHIPSNDIPRVQEAHITVIHMLCDLVEKRLCGKC